MSYELDHIRKCKCACGKGYVVQESYSNDWNQVQTCERIECPECNEKFYIATMSFYHKCESYLRYYLVKKGERISFGVSSGSFGEDIVHEFTKEELQESLEYLKTIKYSTQCQDRVSGRIIHCFKKRYNTVKLNCVRPELEKVINQYDSYQWNALKIKAEQDKCKKTERIELDF